MNTYTFEVDANIIFKVRDEEQDAAIAQARAIIKDSKDEDFIRIPLTNGAIGGKIEVDEKRIWSGSIIAENADRDLEPF
jgi:hypothetical protein